MSLLSLVRIGMGEVGVLPGTVKMISTANLATVTAAGYIKNDSSSAARVIGLAQSDVIEALYDYNTTTNTGTLAFFQPVITAGIITLNIWENPGNVLVPTVSGDLAKFDSAAGRIADSGIAATDVIVTSKNAGQTISGTTSSATPGTLRALKGLMAGTNTTMTSGNLVGLRGEVDLVGASGGFVYGVQGKVIPTGTLSGSVWAPAVFGQYDLSGATLNAGQIAAVWGDMGATGGTFTDVTGARMFAGTNTISSLTLNAMIYLYGKATNLLELSGSSSTYISTAAGSTPSGDLKKIAITIDGVTHYILAAAVYS